MIGESYTFNTIGVVRSCYREKFGIPRQSGLIDEAYATIEITSPYHLPEAWRELREFSHLWVLFVFHQCLREYWSPTVRPPRLGGNTKIGVFASRSGFRPNPIGLSCVRLRDIIFQPEKTCLHISGVDLLDGTPVLDVKPYISYADCIEDACSAYAQTAPSDTLRVDFEAHVEEQLAVMPESNHIRELIAKTIAFNPAPAYQENEGREYGMTLYHYNIRWRTVGERAVVFEIRGP